MTGMQEWSKPRGGNPRRHRSQRCEEILIVAKKPQVKQHIELVGHKQGYCLSLGLVDGLY